LLFHCFGLSDDHVNYFPPFVFTHYHNHSMQTGGEKKAKFMKKCHPHPLYRQDWIPASDQVGGDIPSRE
jgi:hypothetical protein